MMRDRWSEPLERQLAALDQGQAWKPSKYERGILNAMRLAVPDPVTERRIDVLLDRGVRS